ncbi:hypothetical protein WUBG_14410 [Wuchereria bancrofti]|uniref:Uncharacterized protein n=1 Tax=Wuchereria bancrofti TaxID=6293 RepID=J9EH09_WUCBA|nr:hypothetical protein WUBG_14410 [Wuchereria bancrofti]
MRKGNTQKWSTIHKVNLNLTADIREAIITLNIYLEGYEVVLQRLSHEDTGVLTLEGKIITSNATVNLPQL